MFDIFLTRVKGIFSKPTTASPSDPVIKTQAVEESSPASLADNNRVVYSPKKGAPAAAKAHPAPAAQPSVPSAASQAAAAAISAETQKALDNARRLESEAKAKEAEIFQRLSSLDEKERYLIQKEKTLDTQSTELKAKTESVEELYRKQLDKLEQISGLDVDKAKQLIISSTERKMAAWISKKIDEAKENIRQKEDEDAKEILVEAIRHGVTDYVAEYTVSTITLPDEKIKGKIIGREGRNIRAFEKVTGVELELDESNDIRISSFDSTRREIARLALEKLIKDGRIQPLRIEQLVAQTK
ncbi:MAG TPA: Rnase Y domain-containing protein, partial [Patescibacteria group bacterium]